MQLSKKAIEDYKKIFLEEFKVELADKEANEQGVRLLKLMKLIYKPIPVVNLIQK